MPPSRKWLFRWPKPPRSLLPSKITKGSCDLRPPVSAQDRLPYRFPNEQIVCKFRTFADPWNINGIRPLSGGGSDKIVRETEKITNSTLKADRE